MGLKYEYLVRVAVFEFCYPPNYTEILKIIEEWVAKQLEYKIRANIWRIEFHASSEKTKVRVYYHVN